MSKINPEYLCPGCMAVLDEPDLPCPLCGFDKATYSSSPRSLRPFTKLNGKYLVGKVIGEGGFGITYIGFNVETDLPVAIKEYFPAELATRDTTQGNTISIFSGEAKDLYREGLEKYLREARNLSMFSDLPGIVTVKDFFYENETAYIIMEYINGVSLKDYLTKVGGRMRHNEVTKLMKPVLESMNKIHEVGIIHRDISPDNIMITKNKQVKLTDFGAARVFDTEDNKSITVVLKRGYAPEEQYRAKGNQGPWTDVYALCATMYRMISGVRPQEALERIIEDSVEPLSKYDASIWPETEFAIMKGLSLRAQDRYQTVNDLIDALYYSVFETDEEGNSQLVITKSSGVPIEVEQTNVVESGADEFEVKPIVVSIGKSVLENEYVQSQETDTKEASESQQESSKEQEVPTPQEEAPKKKESSKKKRTSRKKEASKNQEPAKQEATVKQEPAKQEATVKQEPAKQEATVKQEPAKQEETVKQETPKQEEPKQEASVNQKTPKNQKTLKSQKMLKNQETAVNQEVVVKQETAVKQETPAKKEVAANQETSKKQEVPQQIALVQKLGFFKSTFKKLVKLQLGKVRFEDTVTDLNVEHMDIGNIQVLKECYELKKLVLNNNMLDDLSPLENCSKLEYLALRNTLVGDLSPISNCQNIKYLDLWGTRVTDLHDIYSLKKLTYLCIKNTEIRPAQVDDFKKHIPNCVVEY